MTNRDVVERFLTDQELYPQGLWGIDRALYSYGLPIAWKELDTVGGRLLVRLADLPVGMSRTTMRHQGLIRRMCRERGVTVTPD